MKKMIKKFLVLALAAGAALINNSCVDPVDLITQDATTGGLVVPAAVNLSFVGDPVTLSLETTASITEVSFYKTYTVGATTSAEVLDKTITVSGGAASYTSDYAALKTGITGMPALPSALDVGDYWTFRIVSKLNDGRLVQSASKIKVTVDNPYSGKYASSGSRWNFSSAADANTSTMPPTGFASVANWTFDTDVSTVDATTCKVHAANDNGGFGTINIQVNADNTVTVISTADTGLANLVPLGGYTSTYNPATKTFTLFYQYTNDNGTHRVLRHYLVRK